MFNPPYLPRGKIDGEPHPADAAERSVLGQTVRGIEHYVLAVVQRILRSNSALEWQCFPAAGGYFWKRFRQEVSRSHASLHRAERMFDRLSALTHGFWICIKTLLHGFEQMLMLPPCNSPLGPGRAL